MPKIDAKITFLILSAILIIAFFVKATRPSNDQAASADVTTSGEPALRVPLAESIAQRARFEQEFRQRPKTVGYPFRDLYEKYIGSIGANGIIATLEKINPFCHEEAHDLGKVIFFELGDVGTSLRTCEGACTDGCMHGVVMEFFTRSATTTLGSDPHVELGNVEKNMDAFCRRKAFQTDYDRPDCAHGVGHAVMFLADYDIGKAMEACGHFKDRSLQVYCATGAYMEYVTTHDAADSLTQSMFYPCETSPFSRACFAYKVPFVLVRETAEGGGNETVADDCMKLAGTLRDDCFNGFGAAFMEALSSGKASLASACRFGVTRDRDTCIAGAMANVARYHPLAVDGLCDALPSSGERDSCFLSGSGRGHVPK